MCFCNTKRCQKRNPGAACWKRQLTTSCTTVKTRKNAKKSKKNNKQGVEIFLDAIDYPKLNSAGKVSYALARTTSRVQPGFLVYFVRWADVDIQRHTLNTALLIPHCDLPRRRTVNHPTNAHNFLPALYARRLPTLSSSSSTTITATGSCCCGAAPASNDGTSPQKNRQTAGPPSRDA
jgi:hypothetical protein